MKAQKQTRVDTVLQVLMFSVAAGALLICYVLRNPADDAYNRTSDISPSAKFPAGFYIKPKGCTLDNYPSSIETQCDTQDTRIYAPHRFGLGLAYKSKHWVRVGNDAVNVGCTFNNCPINYLARDKFYQIRSN